MREESRLERDFKADFAEGRICEALVMIANEINGLHAVLQGVADEIDQHLLEAIAPAANMKAIVFQLDHDVSRQGLGAAGEYFNGIIDDGGNRDGGQPFIRLAGKIAQMLADRSHTVNEAGDA